MQSRIVQLILGELFAFGAFIFGGLALLGGAVTWTGDSRHTVGLSWALVALFTCVAMVLGRIAVARLRRVFLRPE